MKNCQNKQKNYYWKQDCSDVGKLGESMALLLWGGPKGSSIVIHLNSFLTY